MALHEIMVSFGMRYFIGLFVCSTANDSIQRSILKFLRAVVDTNEGKNAFIASDGLDILTSALEEIFQRMYYYFFHH